MLVVVAVVGVRRLVMVVWLLRLGRRRMGAGRERRVLVAARGRCRVQARSWGRLVVWGWVVMVVAPTSGLVRVLMAVVVAAAVITVVVAAARPVPVVVAAAVRVGWMRRWLPVLPTTME